jgi:hypothetical protein
VLPSGLEGEARDATEQHYEDAALWAARSAKYGRVAAAMRHWESTYNMTLRQRKLSERVAQAATEPIAETDYQTASEADYRAAAEWVGPNLKHGGIQAAVDKWQQPTTLHLRSVAPSRLALRPPDPMAARGVLIHRANRGYTPTADPRYGRRCSYARVDPNSASSAQICASKIP